MPASELGKKRTCVSCGAKFYDLSRPMPIRCPKCGFEHQPDVFQKARRSRPVAAPVAAKPAVVAAAAKSDDLDLDTDTVDDTDSDESVLEDASELGEDDDIDDVLGVDDDEEET